VDAYAAHEGTFEEQVPAPATEAELAAMAAAAPAEGIWLDPTYLDFLKVRNGASFNGLMLYGATIPQDDPCMRLDLVTMNQAHWNRGPETVLGTTDLDTFVMVVPRGPFRRLPPDSFPRKDQLPCSAELLRVLVFTNSFPWMALVRSRILDIGMSVLAEFS
jgi:hypothetical protein